MPTDRIPAIVRQPTGSLAVAIVACFVLYLGLRAMGMDAEATGALYAEAVVLVVQQAYRFLVPSWPTDDAPTDVKP